MDDSTIWNIGLGIIMGGIAVAFLIIVVIDRDEAWQRLTVEHECAEYNRTTGGFQWIIKDK